MDWKREALEGLKSWARREAAIKENKQKIQQIEEEMESLRSSLGHGPKVSGGTSQHEDMLISFIAEKDWLQFLVKDSESWLSLRRSVLYGFLTEQERIILDGLIIHKKPALQVCEEVHLEKSQLYKLRDRALERYTMALYGALYS